VVSSLFEVPSSRLILSETRIGEKFLDWTDEDPPLDAIIESVSLYWLTNTAATSLWPYRQVSFDGKFIGLYLEACTADFASNSYSHLASSAHMRTLSGRFLPTRLSDSLGSRRSLLLFLELGQPRRAT